MDIFSNIDFLGAFFSGFNQAMCIFVNAISVDLLGIDISNINFGNPIIIYICLFAIILIKNLPNIFIRYVVREFSLISGCTKREAKKKSNIASDFLDISIVGYKEI